MLKLAEYHSKENDSNVVFCFFFSFKILYCIQSNGKIDRDVQLCMFHYKQKRILNMLLYCRETGLKVCNVSVVKENDNVVISSLRSKMYC